MGRIVLFPSLFYIKSPQLVVEHTVSPTGILAPDFSSNPKPWLHIIPAPLSIVLSNKKTLVLMDPFLNQRDRYELDKIMNALKGMHREGFQILLPSAAHQLVAWQGDMASLDSYIADSQDWDHGRILEEAYQQHQLPADHLVVLDYFLLNHILPKTTVQYQDKADEKAPSAEENTYWDCNANQPTALLNTCIHYWKAHGKKVIHLVIRESDLKDPTDTSPWAAIIDYLKMQEIKVKFELIANSALLERQKNKTLTHSDQIVLQHLAECYVKHPSQMLILESTPSIEAIHQYQDTEDILFQLLLPPNSLPRLKAIYLNDLPSNQLGYLATLLRAAPTLAYMLLRNQNINEAIMAITDPAPSLKEIHLQKINAEALSRILIMIAPKLDIIDTKWVKSIHNAFKKIKNKLLLKEINFSGTDLDNEDIAQLLRLIPQVEKLDLDSCQNITSSAFSKLEAGSLLNLSYLNLNTIPCNVDDIRAIFSAAPNLETIICSAKHLRGIFDLSLDVPPNLNHITLCDSQLSSEELLKFFILLPNLAEINILLTQNNAEKVEMFNAFGELLPHSLPNLKKIKLKDAVITGKQLQKLLLTAPQLEEIYFDSVDFLNQEKINLQSQPFPCLRKIEWSNSHGDNVSHHLYQLCISSPNLEELLITSQNITIPIPLPPTTFRKLRIIALNNTNIDGAQFNQLLQASSNQIKQVTAQMCPYLMNIGKIEVPLPHLERGYFYETPLTLNDIQNLRFAAPYMQIIKPSSGREAYGRGFTAESISCNSTTACIVPRTLHNYPNETLSYTAYFQDIPPSHYRLYRCQVDLSKDTLPTPLASNPTDFKPYTIDTKKTHDQTVEGMKLVSSREGKNIILPSLDFYEKLTAITVFDAMSGEEVPANEIRIEHSDKEGFYRVVLPKKGRYQIKFTITRPEALPLPTLFLRKLQWEYQQYRPIPYILTPSGNSLGELADILNFYRTGGCIHRSIAAYAALTRQPHPELGWESMPAENVRVVINDVHAFIEIFIKIKNIGRWYLANLGGYDAQLIQPKYAATAHSSAAPVTQPQSSRAFKKTVLDEKAPILIETSSATSVPAYYAKMREKYGEGDVFVATTIEDISLVGARVDRSGTVHQETLFDAWIKQSKTVHRALVIDLRQFKQDDLPRLNDLLDHYIGERKAPFEHIDLILLDTVGLHRYGPDFKRRVPRSQHLSVTDDPLLPAMTREKTTEEKTVVINLFHSPYWSQQVLGYWEIGEKLSFKEGILGNLLLHKEETKKPYRICFQNSPLQDPTFLAFLASLRGLHEVTLAAEKITVPDSWSFFTEEAPFELKEGEVILKRMTPVMPPPLVLSDGNLLSFIGEKRYAFDEAGNLKPYPGYFKAYRDAHVGEERQSPFPVIFSPSLSEGGLHYFLTEARKYGIKIAGYLQPKQTAIPRGLKDTPLPQETESFEKEKTKWYLASDLYYTTRSFMQHNPEALAINFSALDPAECEWYPQEISLPTPDSPVFKVKAAYGAVAEALLQGKTVLLYGEISPTLYDTLLSLTQGTIEGKPYPGQLILVTNKKAQSQAFASACMPATLSAYAPTAYEKETLFKASHLALSGAPLQAKESEDYATYERKHLQQYIRSPSPVTEEHDDEMRSTRWDERRIRSTLEALSISPWVMLEGRTGIGKTHFLQHILGEIALADLPRVKIFTDLEKWLQFKGNTNEYAILACDEANASQFLDEARRTERFEGLLSGKRTLVWKGKTYDLSEQHKVVFAFNPDQYGAGRSSAGFLKEHALTLSFDVLPYYYIKARVIRPLLDRLLKETTEEARAKIASVLSEVYGFFAREASKEGKQGEMRITPRELKCIINLIVSNIKRQGITDPEQCARLAMEVAYYIGHQVLDESLLLQKYFERNYAPQASTPSLMQGMQGGETRTAADCPHTQKARLLLEGLMEARITCLNETHTDLGLGGFLLEGPSGVGKTHFVNGVLEDFKKRHPEETPKIRQIKTDLSYTKKIQQLKEAFNKGEIVLINEFNTTLWPIDLLNHFLMGRDEEGRPAKTPGFFLILTQNPAAFEGREALDPAIRRRLVRMGTEDWPVVHAHPSPVGLFSRSPTPFPSKPGTPEPPSFPGPG
jgi:hypothetical protein